MQPTFKPPKTEDEFKERAKNVTADAAQNMINILRRRREAACKPFDEEIKFYKKVLESKESQ